MLPSKATMAFVVVFFGSLLAACDISPAPAQPTPTASTQAVASPTVQATSRATVPAAPSPTDTTVPIRPTDTLMPPPSPPTLPVASPTPVPTREAMPSPSATSPPNEGQSQGASTPTPEYTQPHVLSTPSVTRPPFAPRAITLATGFGSPDDIAVMPNGDILFGDFGNSALNILRPGEKPQPVVTGIKGPEGIVVTRSGAVIVAEQVTNRLLQVNVNTGAKSILRQLTNNTNQDGVDGLGLDPATGDILLPDSPSGRLQRLKPDGSSLQTIASGFVRPVGAAAEANGDIIVVAEMGNAVYRVKKDGSSSRLASLYQPDDVVVGADGSIYVNSLGGDIVRIDPASGKVTVLLSGLKLPQGLNLDNQGNLVITDTGRNKIIRLIIH